MAFERSGFKDFHRRDPEIKSIISKYLYEWNSDRDQRPIFVGYWGEVKDIFEDEKGQPIENKNWPNLLRDRFGMGHLDPAINNEPIPAAVLRYRANDVFGAYPQENPNVAIPTVLDGRLSPFFCPTPRNGWEQGQALVLDFADENDYPVICEMLHRFIEYELDHLFAVGWLTEPPAKRLEQARLIHLGLVRDSFAHDGG